jgi:hypothetical protein
MEKLPPWAVTIAAVAVGLMPGLAMFSASSIARLLHRASWPRPKVVPGSEGEQPHGEPAALASPARMTRRTGCRPLAAQMTRSVSAAGNHLSSLPKWAIWWIALAAVLSPVLAFLGAIGVEVLIGTLVDTGLLSFLAFVVVGAIGWSQLRRPSVRQRGRAPVET